VWQLTAAPGSPHDDRKLRSEWRESFDASSTCRGDTSGSGNLANVLSEWSLPVQLLKPVSARQHPLKASLYLDY
jgi:hypothetical protein